MLLYRYVFTGTWLILKYLVPGTVPLWQQVPGTRYLVPDTRVTKVVPVPGMLEFSNRYQLP